MKRIFSSRRHRYLARVSIFLLMVALVAGMVGCDGDGDYNPPPSENLEIRTWYDLDDVRNNLAGDHILMNDLDSTTDGYTWLASPIANGGTGWRSIYAFEGTLDGQGHKIRDLFINRSDGNRQGLFSLLYKGVIKNIGVLNITVTGCHYIGGLVGENYQGTINNSYCTGNITGDYYVGGLVGLSAGTVSNSYFTGSVTSGGTYVGGLIGGNFGTVSNAYYNHNEVLINGENIITIGALIGDDFEEWLANNKFLDVNERLSQENGYYLVNNVTDFKELLAFGQNASLKFRLKNDLDLASEPNFYIPYFAGEINGDGYKIFNLSFNFGFISQVGLFGYLASDGILYKVAADNVSIVAYERVGGLVGQNQEGTISYCRSSGSVTGEDWWIGGLVGMNYGTVSNSYSTSNVTGDYFVGGLVGFDGKNATVSNSYSSGTVSGNHEVGGLVGDNWGTVNNSYSSSSVSGIATVGGLAGRNIDGHISTCYSTGSVTGNGYVGGLVGRNNEGTVRKSFWDTETSGQSTSDGGTGKTTAQMKNIATFSGAGWNITTVINSSTRNPTYIWNIVDTETYPFLSWQPV